MTRCVQAATKHPEAHSFPVSILEMWAVGAINLAWFVISPLIH